MLDLSARWSARWLATFGLVAGAGVLAAHAAGSRARAPTPEVAVTRAAPPVVPTASGSSNEAAEPPTGLVVVDPITIAPSHHPLDGLSPVELDQIARSPPPSLGSVCVGRPNRGRLLNAVELRSGPGLRVQLDDHGFGTSTTVRFILDAVAELQERNPGAPDVLVGDISRQRGGYLRPHRSHQLGLDADIGYFYDPPARWYTRATAQNLDRRLTWALLKTLIAQGGVEYVFMDRSVQILLRDYAKSAGEPADWVDSLFERSDKKDTVFRHTWGHVTHFHVRFLDPTAEESGRRLEKRLRRAGKI
jgi:hypothetical protein